MSSRPKSRASIPRRFSQPALRSTRSSRWLISGALGLLLLVATGCGSSEASSPTLAKAGTGNHSAPGRRGQPITTTSTTELGKAVATPKSAVTSQSPKSSPSTSAGVTGAPKSASSPVGTQPTAPVTVPTSTAVNPPPVTSSTTTIAVATTTTTVLAAASLAIRNFAFLPSTLTITAGTVVTVTNDDSVTHTWVSNTGAFNSGDIAPGSSYKFTFSTPGTYLYHCSIHPFMTGTIVVQ
jgi:plastocyanin